MDEELMQQVETVQTLIKNNVAGLFGGNHRTRTYGSSSEFADYRDYLEGDDTTKIDWNAYARSEKLYMKLYLDERQMHTKIYIDASRSMAFEDAKKAKMALKIAATFAYISICEMDKVSVYAIRSDRVEKIFGPIVGKESYMAEISKLNDIVFDGEAGISDAIIPTSVGYGDGMSLIISDFLTDANYEAAIDHLAGRRRDVLCIQLLSDEEMSPSARGKMHFFDSESSDKFYRKNIDREIARAYQRALEYTTDRIKNYCAARGADYVLASAEDSVSRIFLEKLVNMGVVK